MCSSSGHFSKLVIVTLRIYELIDQVLQIRLPRVSLRSLACHSYATITLRMARIRRYVL